MRDLLEVLPMFRTWPYDLLGNLSMSYIAFIEVLNDG
jgi:hypothetical protein